MRSKNEASEKERLHEKLGELRLKKKKKKMTKKISTHESATPFEASGDCLRAKCQK